MDIQYLQIVSATVLLGVSSALGFLGLTTEMGFAIGAGAIGLAFSNIDKLKYFEALGIKAEMKEQIKTIIENQTEPELEEKQKEFIQNKNAIEHIDTSVLSAFFNKNFTWRTLSGLSKELKTNKLLLQPKLDSLTLNGYLTESKGRDGRIWALTNSGKRSILSLALQGKLNN